MAHVPFLETVPYRVIAAFTLFQLVYLLGVFGFTFIETYGVCFPLLIVAMIPFR